MDVRTPETWMEILGDLPSPEGMVPEEIMANRVLGDLIGYRHSLKDRVHDARQLAAAMQAYARMMFDAGVRP